MTKFWGRACALSLPVLLLSCQSPQTPRVPGPRLQAAMARSKAIAAAPLPTEDPPLPTLTLQWDYPTQELARVYFVIHGSPVLEGNALQWPGVAQVTNQTHWSFQSEGAGFFWNEAIDLVTGISSGPNR